MRELKFRGKRLDNKGFFYGSYLYLNTRDYDWTGKEVGNKKEVHFIKDEEGYNLPVNPKTVGQYTGLKDCNDVEIYEGDILEYRFHNPLTKEKESIKYEVIYEYGEFRVIVDDGRNKSRKPLYMETNSIVIGNIYQNPELLEGVKQ
ncbi:YopX family protein [Chengkuizengella sp. SCS-71B]|uniref:YopX family protein n=1 Tax=Chengkuizengella sp. SCS-71B TaxID=3115290 RepID=UPI0032C21AE2